jgi:hypothetical protein
MAGKSSFAFPADFAAMKFGNDKLKAQDGPWTSLRLLLEK